MRHTRILPALLCTFLCAAAAAIAQDTPYSRITPLEAAVSSGTATRAQQLELARLYSQVGRFYEASKIAGGLLATDANDAEAIAVRDEATKALHALADKKVAEAEGNARRAGATDQDRQALADAYFEAGSYGAAAEQYARLPESMVTRDIRLRQARALAWSGQMDASERVYTQVLRQQRTPDADLEYGRLLSWMGASHAAVKSLDDVYRANPTQESAVALANARAWSGDREGAIRLLEDFTGNHADAAEARQLLAGMRVAPELRLERVDKLIDLEPYNLALHVDRARLLADTNRYGEAVKEIRTVREHSDQSLPDLDALETRVHGLRDQELAKAEERRKALDTREAKNADEVLALAKTYASLEDYDRGIALYEDYLRLRPDDMKVRIDYARVLGWDRRYTASARQYEKLIEQNPDRADLRLEYAQILSYDSNFAGAVHMFSSLTDISGNPRANLYTDVPSRAHFNLGQIYRWYGWNDHAVEEQNRALAIDSSYVPARNELDLVRRVRPTSNVEARYLTSTDSSQFTLRRIDLSGQKWVSQRMAWNANIGHHEFIHQSDSVSAINAQAGVNYRLSDRTMARGNVGANFYRSGFGTRPFWGVGAEWLPNLQSRAGLDYNHYDLVYDVSTLSSLTQSPAGLSLRDPLSIDDLRGHYDYNTGGHWMWLADGSFGRVSDNNKRAAAHGLLTYRLFKQPFVALKGDARYLQYDFRTPRYWSPTSYHSAAGVLQVGQSLSRLYWTAEVKVGKAWEGSRSSDLRTYNADVTVPVSEWIDVIGSYAYGKSGRLDSFVGSSNTDLVNYWQRQWYVGLRVKQLFSRDDRHGQTPWYWDNRPLSGSPVVPPLGEAH